MSNKNSVKYQDFSLENFLVYKASLQTPKQCYHDSSLRYNIDVITTDSYSTWLQWIKNSNRTGTEITHFRDRVTNFGQNGETTMSDKLNTASDLEFFRSQVRPFSLEPEETITARSLKPSFLKRRRRKAVQKRQSNQEYIEHLAEETLSRVLQLPSNTRLL